MTDRRALVSTRWQGADRGSALDAFRDRSTRGEAAALSGFFGWSAMIVNVGIATRRARPQDGAPDAPLTVSLLRSVG